MPVSSVVWVSANNAIVVPIVPIHRPISNSETERSCNNINCRYENTIRAVVQCAINFTTLHLENTILKRSVLTVSRGSCIQEYPWTLTRS